MSVPWNLYPWPRVIRRTRTWTPTLRFLSAIGRLKHGTIGAYRAGCPCEACRAVNRQQQRKKRGGPLRQVAS